MWLPKDERKVLRKYYNYLQNTQEYERFESLSRRVHIATCNLINRGFLHEIKEGGTEHNQALAAFCAKDSIQLNTFLADYENDIECTNITLSLTLEGYDLGSKYNNWFSRTGLWFTEYKNHWIWLIISFFGGIIGALIVDWLK